MALEFDCPYCQATIRVPDNAAGKRGRCPQCAKKLTVPKAGQTRRAGQEPPLFAPAPETAVPAAPEESAGEVVFDEYTANDDQGIDPAVQSSLPPGDIAIPSLGGLSPIPAPARQLPDSLLSKSKRRRRTPAWVWVIVAVLLLGGGGLAGGIYWMQTSVTLKGELEAKLVDNPPLPSVIVPNAMIQVPAADAGLVLGTLERDPLTLVSGTGLATVQFQGSDQGLLISVQPGAATSLYRVDISDNENLQRYLKEHRRDYERIRDEDLSVAVNQFFRELKRSLKNKKTALRELQEFRDSVGFTAPVQGLGHFVHAGHRQQIYPCVAEDDDALYFLLPPGAKRFLIKGKPQKRGVPFFPGEYEVTVNGSITVKHEGEPPAEPVKKPSSKAETTTETE